MIKETSGRNYPFFLALNYIRKCISTVRPLSPLYLDLYVLGDDAWISEVSFM